VGLQRLTLAAAVAALGLAIAAPASGDDRVIAPGISAGGVDLGGMTVDQAAATLQSVLGPHLRRDLVYTAGGVAYRLSMSQAKLKFDALLTAKRAANATPPPPPDPAAPPPAGGTASGVSVPLALSHARLAVRAWVAAVARQAYHAPRNATVRITLRHLHLRRAVVGRGLNKTAAARDIDTALDTDTTRQLTRRLRHVYPKLNANRVERLYNTVVTVDREHFTLRLFKGLKLRKRYPIAVGMAGLDTPAGRYAIHDKQVNPAWHVPNSAWAGSLAGQTIPPNSPDNPIKARWLGIADGVGIHGTAEDWSIGSRASHGCIRMHIGDVIDLYPRVPVGTPVLIG
jgi:lipoprotein-anchoring transpeptidase ErfK/SrfK